MCVGTHAGPLLPSSVYCFLWIIAHSCAVATTGVFLCRCTLVAELRLTANEHPQFEDDVPQLTGKINEKFVERITDVRLWEAEHKDEATLGLGPRFCRR